MKQRVAIVGAGVAGVVSAQLLQEAYDVTLIEAADRIGGHTNTITVPSGPDHGTPIDTGFIVLNNKNYPLFTKILATLDVPTRWSDMSFGFFTEHPYFLYAGTDLNGLFADRRNLFRPGFYRFLLELKRFCVEAKTVLDSGRTMTETLGAFAKRQGYSERLLRCYLIPMTSAIWSCPSELALEYPAMSLFRFFDNHGLLSFEDRPRWQTVVGGSHSYLRAFERRFRGTIRLSSAVKEIERHPESAEIKFSTGGSELFDQVVLASHADQSFNMLSDPTDLETRLLKPWRYQRNRGFLHYDESILPPLRRGWASWNVRTYSATGQADRSVITYHMNRLQGFELERQYCVSFDCEGLIDEEKVVAPLDYLHPIYDERSVSTQAELSRLNRQDNRTHYCGSYFGYGFHEDAVRSAFKLAQNLGVRCLD